MREEEEEEEDLLEEGVFLSRASITLHTLPKDLLLLRRDFSQSNEDVFNEFTQRQAANGVRGVAVDLVLTDEILDIY